MLYTIISPAGPAADGVLRDRRQQLGPGEIHWVKRNVTNTGAWGASAPRYRDFNFGGGLMRLARRLHHWVPLVVLVIAVLAVACGAEPTSTPPPPIDTTTPTQAAPTDTPVPSTDTPPPTDTPAPTDLVPPTATTAPADTPVPPTSTPEPATATP